MKSVAKQAITKKLQKVNIASSEFKANPYPFYERLRAEAPVYRAMLPDKQPAWLITRYEDVLMVLKDDIRFVNDRRNVIAIEDDAKKQWIPKIFKPLVKNLAALDGIDHSRLRGLIHKAFSPRKIELIQERVQMLSKELLDLAERKGRIDLVKDYALPIPLTIIFEIIGVQAQEQARFHRWAKSLVSISTPVSLIWALPNLFALRNFLRRSFEEKRLNPSDDLISSLVQAQKSDTSLSDDELISLVIVLLVAGYETTVNLIGSGALALMQNPDQLRLLRLQPNLIKNAVEELVRYVSPVDQAHVRYARENIVLHNVTIRKGDRVFAVIASANRDERQFERADQLDITRDCSNQIGFGQGVHYCVGSILARLEGQIAIGLLVQRASNLRLIQKPEKLHWKAGLTVRGVESIAVAF